MLLDSLLYLTVADATVISFLAPLVCCWAYSFLLRQPFTYKEKIAGIVSFLGVIVIARPTFIFGAATGTESAASILCAGKSIDSGRGICFFPSEVTAISVTPAQRMSAILVGLIGVCGAALAYMSIRWIGKRAHPLVSVNYLSVLSTVVSALGLVFVPSIGFRLPATSREWLLLFSLGICGFIMQFLITAGLQHDKGSSRATNMVYTQLLFALAFDYMFLGATPALSSLVGNCLILGSAVYLALQVDPISATKGGDLGCEEESRLAGEGRD